MREAARNAGDGAHATGTMATAETGVTGETAVATTAETGMSSATVATATLGCGGHCGQQQDERRNG